MMCEVSTGWTMLGFVAALSLPGCGGSTERLSLEGAGGMAGATGVSDAQDHTVEGGTSEDDADAVDGSRPADFDQIGACPATKPCLDSEVQLIEGSGHNINVSQLTCVFEALRDRAPAKHRHHTSHAFGNGSVGARHLLLVTSDGGVKYARDRYSHIFVGSSDGGDGRVPDPYANPDSGRHCQLKPARYFEECIQALKAPDGSAAWSCAFGDGTASGPPSELFWFESCTDESPLACD